MLPLIITILCVVSAKGFSVVDGDYLVLSTDTDNLRWAESYSVKGTRVSLTSNIVEDYVAWKTNQSSRVDFNNGAVKIITDFSKKTPTKYQIHPETTKEVFNTIVCNFIYDVLFQDEMVLDEILPYITDDDQYVPVGNETVNDKFTTKFVFNEKYMDQEIRQNIWAAYDDDLGWMPVKYEVKRYNTLLGSLISHDIYNFFEYDPDFMDDENVFDVEKYPCDSEPNQLTEDSEKITKELIFVDTNNVNHLNHIFNHFRNKYNKNYAHEAEHALRKSIFENNVRMIASVNKRNYTYKLGVNQFSDWTPEELKRSHGAIPRPQGKIATIPFPYEESEINKTIEQLPKEFDLRLHGIISPVKNQETCGSCWTFAATAVTESGLARKNGGRVLALSNQAIVDCAYDGLGEYDAGGCDGGYDYSAYDFIMDKGLPTEEEYGPYKNQDGFCNIRNMTKTYHIKGYTDVTNYSNSAMKVAVVNHGPLFIYVDVSDKFQAYSSGIFYQSNDECDPETPNHAVILVGYGEQYGELFWILKNSWGESWGIDGYMLIAAKDNVCGVSAHPSYPVF